MKKFLAIILIALVTCENIELDEILKGVAVDDQVLKILLQYFKKLFISLVKYDRKIAIEKCCQTHSQFCHLCPQIIDTLMKRKID